MRVQSIKIYQIAFGVLALLALLLAGIALFTPAWRFVTAGGSKSFPGRQTSSRYQFDLNVGLFGFLCGQNVRMDLTIGNGSFGEKPDICREWADKKLIFETLAAILLIVGALISLLALLWDLLMLTGKAVADWPKARWLLGPLSSLVTLLFAVAVIVYAVEGCRDTDGNLPSWENPVCSLGFSFVLAVLATLCALLATVAGFLVLVLHRRLVQGSNAYWS